MVFFVLKYIFSLQRYLHFWIMQMRKAMTSLVVPLKQYNTESSVSGAFMITLLYLFAAIQDYRTFNFVFSQRFSPFTPIIPCADWEAYGSCKMTPLCFNAYIFLPGDFFQVNLSFHGTVSILGMAKTSNNVLPSCILAPF